MESEISGVYITLKVGGVARLFLMVARDGTVNRAGDGTLSSDNAMFIGKSTNGEFEKLELLFEPVLSQWIGGFSDEARVGNECRLIVGFMYADGQETKSAWQYGEDSMGPPDEVQSIVISAIQVTDEWFHEQRKVAKL